MKETDKRSWTEITKIYEKFEIKIAIINKKIKT
jgi:hypothetical protein